MMATEVVDDRGFITPGRVACGAAVLGWVYLRRHIRELEHRVVAVARKAELARRDADRRFRAFEEAAAAAVATAVTTRSAGASAGVDDLQAVRDAVQEMIRQAEYASAAYAPGAACPE